MDHQDERLFGALSNDEVDYSHLVPPYPPPSYMRRMASMQASNESTFSDPSTVSRNESHVDNSQRARRRGSAFADHAQFIRSPEHPTRINSRDQGYSRGAMRRMIDPCGQDVAPRPPPFDNYPQYQPAAAITQTPSAYNSYDLGLSRSPVLTPSTHLRPQPLMASESMLTPTIPTHTQIIPSVAAASGRQQTLDNDAQTKTSAKARAQKDRTRCACACGCTTTYPTRKTLANLQCAPCIKRNSCTVPAASGMRPPMSRVMSGARHASRTMNSTSRALTAPVAAPSTGEPELPYQDIFADEAAADKYHNHEGAVLEYLKLSIEDDDVNNVSDQQALEYRKRLFNAILATPPAAAPDGVDQAAYTKSQDDAFKLCKKNFARADSGRHASACCAKLYYTAVAVHKKGIPLSELEKTAATKTVSGHALDFDSTFTVRMEKIIVAMETKRIADDVVRYENLFDLACAPDSCVARKLHNVNANAGRSRSEKAKKSTSAGQVQHPAEDLAVTKSTRAGSISHEGGTPGSNLGKLLSSERKRGPDAEDEDSGHSKKKQKATSALSLFPK